MQVRIFICNRGVPSCPFFVNFVPLARCCLLHPMLIRFGPSFFFGLATDFATDHRPVGPEVKCLARTASTAEFAPLGEDAAVEYFFASDASAVIEHTNRVIFLQVCPHLPSLKPVSSPLLGFTGFYWVLPASWFLDMGKLSMSTLTIDEKLGND